MSPAVAIPYIYVAGPYRGANTFEIDRNIHHARRWGAFLVKAGAYPMIPHSNTAHFDGLATDAVFLEGTLEAMRRCDGVLFIPGWVRSSGSRGENVEARRLGIPTLNAEAWDYRSTDDVVRDLVDWLAKVPRVPVLRAP